MDICKSVSYILIFIPISMLHLNYPPHTIDISPFPLKNSPSPLPSPSPNQSPSVPDHSRYIQPASQLSDLESVPFPDRLAHHKKAHTTLAFQHNATSHYGLPSLSSIPHTPPHIKYLTASSTSTIREPTSQPSSFP